MASSTWLGAAPWCSHTSSYSARVSPSASASSSVGSVALSGTRALGGERHRAEDAEAVGGAAGELLDRVLGVRHQPEHVAGGVAHAGDVVARAVEVVARGVAEHDLVVALERSERVGVGVVAAPR